MLPSVWLKFKYPHILNVVPVACPQAAEEESLKQKLEIVTAEKAKLADAAAAATAEAKTEAQQKDAGVAELKTELAKEESEAKSAEEADAADKAPRLRRVSEDTSRWNVVVSVLE